MKKVLKVVAVAALVLLTFVGCAKKDASGDAAADKTFNLKIAHIQPAEHPNGKGAEYFKQILEERSNGRIKVSVFPAAQLGNEAETFDSLALGTIDFAFIGYGDAAKQCPEFMLLDAPYLRPDRESWVETLNGDAVKKLQSGLPAASNVRALANFYYGARYMTTAALEVREPADLSGHTIRVPDQKMYVDTLNAMGATATPMAMSELFLSLQQRVVDGQENPVATIAANSFNEAQKYLIKTEHIIGGNCIYVSEKTMNKLPADLQTLIQECALEAANYTTELAFEAEDRCKDELVEKGMILIEDVDKEAFMKATDPIYAELATKIDPELIKAVRGR